MSITKLITAIKGGPGSGNWGHAGRPGKRGGSAPSSLGFLPVSADIKEIDENAVAYYGHGNEMVKYGSSFTDDEAAEQKDLLVTKLADATGLNYEDVNLAVLNWSYSANDTLYASLEMQKVLQVYSKHHFLLGNNINLI